MRLSIGLVLSAVVLAFAVSGCGESPTKSSGSSGAAPKDGPTFTPEAPPPPPPPKQ